MPKLPAFVAAASAVLLSFPAAAQPRPASLGEIYESYNDCFAVASRDGFRPAAIESLGWRLGQVERDAGSGAEAVAIYGHSSRSSMIVLNTTASLCIVLARLEDAGKFDEFQRAWNGQLPRPDAEGVIHFSAEGRTIRLARTGTQAAPSLSIAVMAPTEN